MVLPRRRRRSPEVTLERQPDGLPKTGLFAEPIRVTTIEPLAVEELDDGEHRVTFLVEVKDAEDKRCSDLSVEARVSGPHRASTVQGTTDLFGRLRFRMAGPPGRYGIEVTDVAAYALRWDVAASVREAVCEVSES